MKKHFHRIIIAALVGCFLFHPEPIDAVELDFYPRLETGIMSYSIKYDAISNSSLSSPGQASARNKTKEKIEYSDDMSFIGGGATLFVNRFYIDLSRQYAFDGSDSTASTYSSYKEIEDQLTNFTSYEANRNAQFDHTNNAIAVGYAISRNFSVFTGYKWAALDLETKNNAAIFSFFVDDSLIFKSLADIETDVDFKYEGPFVGTLQGWEIDTLRYLKGVFTIKLGLAYLNSKYMLERRTRLHDLTFDQHSAWVDHEESKGDTWGFTLGLGWRGNTPIKDLTYSLQIGGYRYDFNTDDTTLEGTSETVLNYKAAISYGF